MIHKTKAKVSDGMTDLLQTFSSCMFPTGA